ncbi:uncharacterized protein DS421_11g329560 [Arachis hypogaea]|nr:uncharacterized protein DS421_11g329560 [Arachis hypogaea]
MPLTSSVAPPPRCVAVEDRDAKERRPRVTVLEASVVTVQSRHHRHHRRLLLLRVRRSLRERSLLPLLLPPENTSAATEICRRRHCQSSGRRCRSRWLPELPPNRFSDRRCFIFLVRCGECCESNQGLSLRLLLVSG